jgi:hypothetical protein
MQQPDIHEPSNGHILCVRLSVACGLGAGFVLLSFVQEHWA